MSLPTTLTPEEYRAILKMVEERHQAQNNWTDDKDTWTDEESAALDRATDKIRERLARRQPAKASS